MEAAPSVVTTDNPTSATPKGGKKFPFMMVTIFLIIVVFGLTGSFLILKMTDSGKKSSQPLITPPVTVEPTKEPINPFATTSAEIINPFASPTPAYKNPFGTVENPFVTGGSNQTYQNPFEKLK